MEDPELDDISFSYTWADEPYEVLFSPLPLTDCYDVEVTFAIHLQWRGRYCGAVTEQIALAILKWSESDRKSVLPAGFVLPGEDCNFSDIHLLAGE